MFGRNKGEETPDDADFGNPFSGKSHTSAKMGMEAMGMGSPIRRPHPRYVKFKKSLYWLVPVGLGLVIISAIVTTLRVNTVESNVMDRYSEAYNPSFRVKYQDLGSDIIQSWFSYGPAPVNYGGKVQWPGTTSAKNNAANPEAQNSPQNTANKTVPEIKNITFVYGEQVSANLAEEMISTEKDKFKNPKIENLTYRLSYNSQVLNVSISLLIPDVLSADSLPILIANPTMTPTDPGIAEPSGVGSDPRGAGMGQANLSEQAKTVISQWSTAWSEDQRVALKQLAQDQSTKTYRGLGGWSTKGGATPTIVWQYNREIAGDKDKYVVAEIEFQIFQSFTQKLPGQTAGTEKPTVEQNYSSTQTMNVLIAKADTGLPAVVAWGPSGSWQELKPFMNGTEPKSATENNLNQTTSTVNKPGGSGSNSPTTSSTHAPTAAPTQTQSPVIPQNNEGGLPEPELPPAS